MTVLFDTAAGASPTPQSSSSDATITNLASLETAVATVAVLTDNSGGGAADGTIGAVTVGSALVDNSGGTAADGTIAAVAATAAATAGGSTPTAAQVDTGIATAVAPIVTKTNDAIKELATASESNRAAISALRDAVKELSTKLNALILAVDLSR